MLKNLVLIGISFLVAIEPMPAHNQVSGKRPATQRSQNAENPPQPTIAPVTNNQAANYYQQESTDKPQGWHKLVTWPEGITAWLIMLTLGAIIWQAWETRKAAKATEEAVREAKSSGILAETTAKRELRAYLSISKSLVKFTDDGCLEGQFDLKNGGQTPAYRVEGWSRVFFAPHPFEIPSSDPPNDLMMSSGIISSDDHRTFISEKLQLTEALLKAIQAPTYAFYMIGRISYVDIFKDVTHVLEYRLIFGGPAKVRTFLDTNQVKCGRFCMDTRGNYEWDDNSDQNPK